LNATTSTNLLTIGSNCRIEDVTLTLTTSSQPVAGAVYSVFKVSDNTVTGPSTKLRTLVANLNLNNPSGSGAGLVTNGSSATNFNSAYLTRGCTINVNASNLDGNCYAKCVDVTGKNRTSLRDTILNLTATNCSGSRIIACETSAANSVIDIKTSTVSASGSGLTNCSLAEISQTAAGSVIYVGAGTNLENHSANNLGFTMDITPANSTFGVIKTKGGTWSTPEYSGDKYYLSYGTSLLTDIANISADAIVYSPPQTCILHDITLRTNVSVGTSTLYTNVYCNSVTPAGLKTTLALSGNAILARDDTISFKMFNTDKLFIELSGTGGVPTGFRNAYVDVGTF